MLDNCLVVSHLMLLGLFGLYFKNFCEFLWVALLCGSGTVVCACVHSAGLCSPWANKLCVMPHAVVQLGKWKIIVMSNVTSSENKLHKQSFSSWAEYTSLSHHGVYLLMFNIPGPLRMRYGTRAPVWLYPFRKLCNPALDCSVFFWRHWKINP